MGEPTAPSAAEVAETLATALDNAGCEYAIGGALALGCWTTPRGTVDVDVTLFLPPERIDEYLDTLQSIGAEFSWIDAQQQLKTHGYCRITYQGRVLDVFQPIAEFYATAKSRRVEVPFKHRSISVWDAATLCVFKMMFFRRKDLADVEQLLRTQGSALDTEWVSQQVIAMFGQNDPRTGTWQQIVDEVSGEE
ncbi:hypothetical protein Pan181_02700 [Aeoliella mucimassa]|uniref:Nucleotidyltransferase family protein n=2 Tax=Aeoliella mucimassa TaxID=2527972 RepID=A0A518AH82_9BACT|nr:hypothetical protein Pan181_02700 [Aeoliella mucimassa]